MLCVTPLYFQTIWGCFLYMLFYPQLPGSPLRSCRLKAQLWESPGRRGGQMFGVVLWGGKEAAGPDRLTTCRPPHRLPAMLEPQIPHFPDLLYPPRQTT